MRENTTPSVKLNEHHWSYDLRRWVIIGLVIALAFVLYWIRDTLPTFIIALLVAYLLNPIVHWLKTRLRIPRLLAIALIYLVLVVSIIAIAALAIPALIHESAALASQLDKIVAQISTAAQQLPFLAALGVSANSDGLAQQMRTELGTVAAQIPALLIGAASRLFNVILILVLSFYLLKEAESLEAHLASAIPAAYRKEAYRIKNELIEIWSGFLRGQIMLALLIGLVTGVTLGILGVRNAFLLGVLAGLLEVVPTIGPIIAAIPSVLIAFFQGSTHWTLDNALFALIVVGAYVVIQQLENHLIVPNILGRSVNLPAVVILFGALAGASLAGVLGIFLAPPILATARLFLQFIARKLFEPLPVDVLVESAM